MLTNIFEKIFRNVPLTVLLCLTCLWSACSELSMEYLPVGKEKDDTGPGLQLSNLTFSDNSQYYTFDVGHASLSIPALDDTTQVRLKIFEEFGKSKVKHPAQPSLVSIDNVSCAYIDSIDLKLLIVVDLTVPQQQIDTERKAIQTISTLFRGDQLYVSFMHPDTLTDIMQVTPYVMAHYFVEDNARPGQLYRSIITSARRWYHVDAKYHAMIVFSDGDVYTETDLPIDPDHSLLQQQIIALSETALYPCYFVCFEGIDAVQRKESSTLLKSAALRTGGDYYENFTGDRLLADINKYFNIPNEQYRITLSNPKHRVYLGNKHVINLECYDLRDSLLTSGQLPYHRGNLYHPQQVDAPHLLVTFLTAVVFLLIVLILAYIGFQLIEPRIRNYIFNRRYVTRYEHSGMSYRGIMIQESCYYCKAPFQEGELIVAHCPHVVHKECWDEAGGHCPEHGRNCHAGAHVYNSKNIFDTVNASFYTKWVILSILAGFLAWLSYFLLDVDGTRIANYLILKNDFGYKFSTAQEISHFEELNGRIAHMPIFGLCVGFWFTALLGLLSVRETINIGRNILYILGRAVVVAIVSSLLFLLDGLIAVYLFDSFGGDILIDWVPWFLSGFLIALAITWRTHVPMRYKYVAIALLVGLVFFYLSDLLRSPRFSVHALQMISFVVCAVSFGVSLAVDAPRSSHYFLHVTGAIKDIDIAVYKIFQNSPQKEMTIGKSVECDLQLSWDLTSNIAPVMAKFSIQHGRPILETVEEGVIMHHQVLSAGKKVHLYHGRSFSIGKTKFTYIEKDF